jgi:hypothetical protein
VSKALGAIAAGITPNIGPGTGPMAVVEQGPPTPPRPEPTTVRTWQPQAPPTRQPTRGYSQQRAPQRDRARTYPSGSGPAWRRRLITAAAIIVAALVGILVANAFVDTSGDQPSSAASVGSTPDPSVANAPLPSAQPTYTTAPLTTTQTVAAPPPGPMSGTPTYPTMVAVLHTYLAMLPAHATQAFQLLTPAQQARSGGLSGYLATWNTVKSVQPGIAVPHGTNGAAVRVQVTTKQGKSTDDTYQFTFVDQNGSVLIDNIAAIGGARTKHD